MNNLNNLDDVFGEDENPYIILIKELRRSNDFFQLLSKTLNNPFFKKQADSAIQNLNDIENYILTCNESQIDELLARISGF
jgi:hypothetical protein